MEVIYCVSQWVYDELMGTKRWSNFVEYTISKNRRNLLVHGTKGRDLWSLVMF